MTGAVDVVAERIARHGPVPFDDVMRIALYDPDHGFYATGGAAGRRGDFITSAEVGPLFGAVLGRALDVWWRELGEPDPFVVIEAAAGVGTLARSVLAGAPACLPALTYVLVEQSVVLRARHGEHLPISDPSLAFPPIDPDRDETTDRARGSGPRFVSLGELPAVTVTGVVLANELLDNLPTKLLEHRDGSWHEVFVALGEAGLVEHLVPASDQLRDHAARLVPAPAERARVPLQLEAAAWTRRALAVLDRGHVALFDYADVTPSLAARPVTEWLRTYRAHERGVGPLDALGHQDITCEVAIDQVAPVRAGMLDGSQAEFLQRFGIDELVAEGRRVWHERAGVGDLAAIKARSRVHEAEALLDPAGLGSFRVLEWTVGGG